MRQYILAIVAFLVLTGIVHAQPGKLQFAPDLLSVLSVDAKKGKINLIRAVTEMVPITRSKEVMENGVLKTVTFTTVVPVTKQVVNQVEIATMRFMSADKKQFPLDELYTKLKPGTAVALGFVDTPPSDAFLNALNPNLVVILVPSTNKK